MDWVWIWALWHHVLMGMVKRSVATPLWVERLLSTTRLHPSQEAD